MLDSGFDFFYEGVEESLRFRSPTQYMMRTARDDFEIHGRTIPAGETLTYGDIASRLGNKQLARNVGRG